MFFAEIGSFFSPCENCELLPFCDTPEATREIGKAMSYRDRAIITEQEFEEMLGPDRLKAAKACEEAQYVLRTCILFIEE